MIPREPRPHPWPWVMLAFLATVALFGFLWATMPRDDALGSARPIAPGSSVSPAPATYPPELLMAAIALATEFAPPTVKPDPVESNTVVPDLVCGDGVKRGVVCTMATAVPPSPTPLPSCPVKPGGECVSTGVWPTPH